MLQILVIRPLFLLSLLFSCFGRIIKAGEIRYILTDEVDGNTFIGNIIHDASLDKKYETETLKLFTFRFLSSPSADFVIEEKTGVLCTSGTIDRDVICPRLNVCEIKLDIALQPVQYFQIIKVSIEILDLNDNAPTFPEQHVTHQILESASPGASFLLTNAVDDDSQQFGIRGYDIITDTRKFDLQFTKKVDGSSDVRIILKERLDREIEEEYDLTVIAYDGGQPSKTGSVDITITVLDANDHDPKFEEKLYEVTIAEDIEIDTSIIKVHAIDPDAGRNGRVVYSFSQRTYANYGEVFGLDSDTGEIYITGSIDYETATLYHLSVLAQDKGPDSLPDDATVMVRVTDINDHAPEITLNTLSSSGSDIAEIQEDSEIGTFVAHVTVIDRDKGINGEVGCSLNGEDFELVKLYISEYKIVTAVSLDREQEEYYDMMLLCQDKGNQPQVETKEIKVRVKDVNDHKPVFERSEYDCNLIENNFVGAYVIQVNASDDDLEDNARIQYSVQEDAVDIFNIEPKSGLVTAAISFDREEISAISFYVLAIDHGSPLRQTGSVLVHLTIQDVNDETPQFAEENYSFSTFENEAVGSEVGQVYAVDMDDVPYDEFTYSMIRSRSDVDSFSIDPNTGTIRTRNVLNREELSVYFLVVIAEDCGIPPLTSTVNVNIQVLDRNDWQPAFVYPSPYNNTVFLSNQVTLGYQLATIQAQDMDINDNARITYTIIAGNDEKKFDIDGMNGHIRVMSDLSGIEHELYELTVQAQDHGLPPLKAQAILYILVNKTIGLTYTDKQHWTILDPNSLTFIIALAVSSAFITILLLIIIICVRRRDRSKQEHGKYNCRTEAMKMLNSPHLHNMIDRAASQEGEEEDDEEEKVVLMNGYNTKASGAEQSKWSPNQVRSLLML